MAEFPLELELELASVDMAEGCGKVWGDEVAIEG